MIVEDEAVIRMELEQLISSMNLNVACCCSQGREAIKKTAETDPDLILMDIVIPGDCDGIEAAKTIKNKYDKPVVFLTAYSDDMFLSRANEMEYYGYIIKPVNEKRLKAVIELAFKKYETENKYKSLLEERNTLINEIHHRVKNNFNLILNLIEMEFSNSEDEKILNSCDKLTKRIMTLSKIHENLYQSKNTNHINISYYLRNLAYEIIFSYNMAENISIEYKGENLVLNINYALPCALIANEIITNAAKHAFKKDEQGTVTITAHDSGQSFMLSIADNGKGVPEKQLKNKKELSGGLIKSLVKQLNGDIEVINDNGLKYTLMFPIAH